MIQVYQKYIAQIRGMLMQGDMSRISEQTGIGYDAVARVLREKNAAQANIDPVIEAAIEIIDQRVLEAKQLIQDFSKDKALENEIAKEQAELAKRKRGL